MRQWIRAEVTAIDGILLSATGWVKVSGRMEKTWLSHYQAGVPPIIELDPEESLANLFDTACSNFGASPAFTNLGRTMTYGQLENLSARFAAYLQTVAGLERGDRVGLALEACAAVGVGGYLGGQGLERDVSVKLGVLSLPDDTHAPLADLLDQSVVQHLRSGLDGHSGQSPTSLQKIKSTSIAFWDNC